MTRTLCLLLALGLVAGCDATEEQTTPGAGGDAGAAPPHDPPEGDIYVAGLEKAGAEGHLKVQLLDALPAPPERGDNTWELRVLSMADTPLTDCTVAVVPDMPAHGHGTTPVEIAAGGDGTFSVRKLNLFMPGLWIIPIDLTCGDVTDRVIYEFWIEG